jgi:hypothetical protein
MFIFAGLKACLAPDFQRIHGPLVENGRRYSFVGEGTSSIPSFAQSDLSGNGKGSAQTLESFSQSPLQVDNASASDSAFSGSRDIQLPIRELIGILSARFGNGSFRVIQRFVEGGLQLIQQRFHPATVQFRLRQLFDY